MEHDFRSTHWSAVFTAGQGVSSEARQALASLCEIYWYPLYAYAVRRVATVDEAQDLTQAFFTELLEKNFVGSADPERGRFRAFLLTAFKHFMAKQWQKEKALKRGGGRQPISLHFPSADSTWQIDPSDGLTAEQAYDQQWVIALLGQTLDRLQRESEHAGRGEQFAALKGFIIGNHGETTYAQIAEDLNMSAAAAKKSASRMRERYRQLLREEIAQTVSGTDEIEDEIRSLFRTLEG
ncbi:MAG: sigma-70 family RNA polymerase sigma factor [Planctomycetota bacterium]